MRRSIPNILLILLSLFLTGSVEALTLDEECVAVNKNGQPRELTAGWRYHPGDDTRWKSLDYDDSSWEVLETTEIRQRNFLEKMEEGTGWFRLTIEVDSSLFNKILAVDIRLSGAAQMYLNGELIYSWGKVGQSRETTNQLFTYLPFPKIIRLGDTHRQVIAIRFANHYARQILRESGYVGFVLSIAEPWPFQKFIHKLAEFHFGMHKFAFGASVAIAMLHLLLFAFFPQERSNLYYFFFVLGLIFIMLGTNPFTLETSFEQFLNRFIVFKLGLLLTGVFSMIFMFSLFRARLPKFSYLIAGIGLLLALFTRLVPVTVIYLFTLLIFPINGFELFRAWKQKKEGAVIVIDGLFVSMFFFTYQMLADLNVFPRFITFLPMYQEYLAGVLVLVMTISIFLAWRVGKTNRDLEDQLIQVQELSEINLQQEREAQEEKLRIKTLEMENAKKDIELDEARKRQLLMEQLEDANTELELMNKELVQTQTQLVQSEKMASLGLLTAGVAHEINTPVGAIYSTQDTLGKAVDKLHSILKEELGESYLERQKLMATLKAIESVRDVIKSGGERVATIVKRMKSFARLDEAELKRTDIHEGLDDTLTMLAHELRSNIEVKKEYGDLKPFRCYPGQLNQVFLNILMNGIQAMPDGGTLSIKTWIEGDTAFVALGDTGKGIPSSNLPKIFDPGFTTKGVGIGSGLGLSICYNIIKNHDGKIEVTSEPDKGTTFTIRLPYRT